MWKNNVLLNNVNKNLHKISSCLLTTAFYFTILYSVKERYNYENYRTHRGKS